MRKYIPAISAFLFGQGVAGMLAYFENTTPALIISICAAVAGISLFIWEYRQKVIQPKPLNRVEYQRLYEIIPLLRQMDRYLWSIADSYKIKNVDMKKFRELGTKSNELLNLKTATVNPKKSLGDWLKRAKRAHTKNSKIIKKQLATSDIEQINKLMVATTHLVDSEGYGLKNEKGKDKRYRGYRRQIDKYHDDNRERVDSWLTYLIHLHIHMSEYFANGLLILKRTNWISVKTRMPSVMEITGPETQANLADLENDSNERLNEIRTQISEYVKDLEKEQWQETANVNIANQTG